MGKGSGKILLLAGIVLQFIHLLDQVVRHNVKILSQSTDFILTVNLRTGAVIPRCETLCSVGKARHRPG